MIFVLGRIGTMEALWKELANDDEFMGYFVAVVGVCIVIWIIAAIVKGKQSIENHAQPVQSVQAKIIAVERFGGVVNAYIFECEDSVRRRFVPAKKDLKIFVEGDAGVLTFQGNDFQSFELNQVKENA